MESIECEYDIRCANYSERNVLVMRLLLLLPQSLCFLSSTSLLVRFSPFCVAKHLLISFLCTFSLLNSNWSSAYIQRKFCVQSATTNAAAGLCARIEFVHLAAMELEAWQWNTPGIFFVHFEHLAMQLYCGIEFNTAESQNQNQMQIEQKSLIIKWSLWEQISVHWACKNGITAER